MFVTKSALRALFLGSALALGAIAAAAPTPAVAAEEVNVKSGYAVHGYDVVAYFNAGKPTPGVDAFTAEHGGAKYRFASAQNQALFQQNPDKYAPQYGGFCAFGAAMGRKFDGDPTAWRIVDDKLYLNLNAKVQERWLENVPGFIRGAENNWKVIRSVADAQLEKQAPAGVTIGAQ